MNYYQNKTAIVTGGASGLGQSLCEELGRKGAIVIPVDIDQEGAQQVASSIIKEGGEARSAYLDVTLFENATRIVEDIAKKYGHIDFMFNNAGTAIMGETRDLKVEHWRGVIDVNLWGVIYGAIAVYNVMAKQGGGQIVNISSLGGLIPLPKEIPYCTSKWAIVGFSNSLRIEGSDLGVKVNLVCPGVIGTQIHETVPLVNVERRKMTKPKGIKFITPDSAAKIILQGVEKNRATIIFPFYARLIWWTYRIAPYAFHLVFQKMIRDFRKIRTHQ